MDSHPNLLLSYIKSRSRVYVYERYHEKAYKDNINWQYISRFTYYSDDDNICSICLNKYILPRMDKCGHIFCLSCLLNLSKHEQTAFVLCPICKNYNINVSETKRVWLERNILIKPDSKLTFELLVKGNQSIFPDYYYNLVSPLPRAPFSTTPNSIFCNINVDKDTTSLKLISGDLQRLKMKRKRIIQLNGKDIEHETVQFLFNEMADFKMNICMDRLCKSSKYNSEVSLDCFNFILDFKKQSERFTLFYQCVEGRSVLLELNLNKCFMIPEFNPHFKNEPMHFKSTIIGKVVSSRTEKVTQAFINQTQFTHLPIGSMVTLVTINPLGSERYHPEPSFYEMAMKHRNAIYRDKKLLEYSQVKSAAKRKDLESKGIMFTPMIDDSFRNGLQNMSINRLSEDTNPSTFNLCMLGLDCDDPDDDYPHCKDCKYYLSSMLPKESDDAWLEEEVWYWKRSNSEGSSNYTDQSIPGTSPKDEVTTVSCSITDKSIPGTSPKDKVTTAEDDFDELSSDIQINMIEQSLSQPLWRSSLNIIEEPVRARTPQIPWDMIEDDDILELPSQATTKTGIEEVETVVEVVSIPEVPSREEILVEPLVIPKLKTIKATVQTQSNNIVDDSIPGTSAKDEVTTRHPSVPKPVIEPKINTGCEKNYPPDNIREILSVMKPLPFEVKPPKKCTQREEKRRKKEQQGKSKRRR